MSQAHAIHLMLCMSHTLTRTPCHVLQTGNDPDYGGTGAADTGADYNPAPGIPPEYTYCTPLYTYCTPLYTHCCSHMTTHWLMYTVHHTPSAHPLYTHYTPTVHPQYTPQTLITAMSWFVKAYRIGWCGSRNGWGLCHGGLTL